MSTGVTPLLKWAGGKRRVLKHIIPKIPEGFSRYFEPFLGGGSVFFELGLECESFVSDLNSDLIEFYEVVRDDPEGLVSAINSFERSKEVYYEIRNLDREPDFRTKHSAVYRAARFYYLNRNGFNGLYRVNNQGQFNVPFGARSNRSSGPPPALNEDAFLAASRYLQAPGLHSAGGVHLLAGSYQKILTEVEQNDFVYLDPPYDPISKTASFVSYSSEGFSRDDQLELRDSCLELDRNKALVLISNSDTGWVRKEFIDNTNGKFSLCEAFDVRRTVSADPTKRNETGEILIWNYPNRMA